ncbi:glycosyltransferase family 2 protein [Kovacikia minuta CCNUW1]|uniref:glycosyltransferase family 2 protein n=1 Tax=Kovacikia minuta TaxID=2931930 RepID=UPI001CC92A35|nr:glycosyltransferase family 2 protein [Kovacikia minuta]UBF27658.1 glycosyltransferase family 2 protein [Kovacikia minuta CCNUW1]
MEKQASALVSVIIPCFNGAHFLTEAIDSVLAQNYPHYEVIIVDDGSTDATKEIALRYPEVRYIYQENQGVSVARNRGHQESMGEYLLFLDYDDRLLPNALETNVKFFKSYPDCGCVAGRYRVIDANGNSLHLALADQSEIFQLSGIVDYKTLISGHTLACPSGSMFQRHILDAVNGFDPFYRSGEDMDLYLRIARKLPIFCHDQIIFEYRRHDTNKSGDGQRAMKNCLGILERQWAYIEGNPEYEAAYKMGRKMWEDFFYKTIPYDVAGYIKRKKFGKASELFLLGLRHSPYSFIQYIIEFISKRLRFKESI